jgi:hypothetical protein
MAKNLMGKSRKPGNAYITTWDPRTGWTWEVLKTWQADGSKPYARAFCNVHGFATEMGDCYVADIGDIITDFDETVFANEDEARVALFGAGIPSAPLPF